MTELVRKDRWEGPFQQYLRNTAGKKLEIGVFDCVQWSLGGVQVITGTRPAPWLTGYSSYDEAREILKSHGWKDTRQAFTETIHPPLADPFRFRNGDLIMLPITEFDPDTEIPDFWATGIIYHRAFLLGEDRLMMLPPKVLTRHGAIVIPIGWSE